MRTPGALADPRAGLWRLVSGGGYLAHLAAVAVVRLSGDRKIYPQPSVRGVRLAWIGIAFCLLVVVGCSGAAAASTAEALANQSITSYTVDQIVDGKVGDRTYARVTGVVFDWMVETTMSGRYDHASYLLGDPTRNEWLLVRTWKTESEFDGLIAADGTATVTGMIRTDYSDFDRAIAALGNELPPVTMGNGIILDEGQTPANPLFMAPLAVASGLLGLLVAAGWAAGYVVFRRASGRPTPPPEGLPGDLPVRATAVLPTLAGGIRAREASAILRAAPTVATATSFVEAAGPSVEAAGPSVELVLPAVSLRLSGHVSSCVAGVAYPAKAIRPALRLRVDGRNLLLTFDSDIARDAAFGALSRSRGPASSGAGTDA